jgi:hypothetical protein
MIVMKTAKSEKALEMRPLSVLVGFGFRCYTWDFCNCMEVGRSHRCLSVFQNQAARHLIVILHLQPRDSSFQAAQYSVIDHQCLTVTKIFLFSLLSSITLPSKSNPSFPSTSQTAFRFRPSRIGIISSGSMPLKYFINAGHIL